MPKRSKGQTTIFFFFFRYTVLLQDKTKHRVPRTPRKTEVKSGAPEVWKGLHQTCVGHSHLNYSCIQRNHDNIARKYERETNTKITNQLKKLKTCETLNRITLSPTTTYEFHRQNALDNNNEACYLFTWCNLRFLYELSFFLFFISTVVLLSLVLFSISSLFSHIPRTLVLFIFNDILNSFLFIINELMAEYQYVIAL